MSILRLFDVSQYVYSGVANKVVNKGVVLVDGVYKARSIPCAGVANVLNAYLQFKEPDADLIFCFDSPPTFKQKLHKELFPYSSGYKGNRQEKSPVTRIQLELTEEILRQSGIRAIKVKGYEADDIIASIVRQYKSSYDKIYIHSRDSDLYYLVCPNVEVVPVIRVGKYVNMTNWAQTVDKDYVIAYNTLTLVKMERGERSDNIPSVKKEIMEKILEGIPKSLYPYCGEDRLLRGYVKEISENDKVTMGIFDLIVPRTLNQDEIELFEEELEEPVLEAYAVECKCRGYCSMSSLCLPVVEETFNKYIEEYMEVV